MVVDVNVLERTYIHSEHGEDDFGNFDPFETSTRSEESGTYIKNLYISIPGINLQYFSSALPSFQST